MSVFHNRKNTKMSYGIVGLGRFGYALATELSRADADLLILDSDEEKVREMREVTENALVIKSLDKNHWRKQEFRTAMWRWCVSGAH